MTFQDVARPAPRNFSLSSRVRACRKRDQRFYVAETGGGATSRLYCYFVILWNYSLFNEKKINTLPLFWTRETIAGFVQVQIEILFASFHHWTHDTFVQLNTFYLLFPLDLNRQEKVFRFKNNRFQVIYTRNNLFSRPEKISKNFQKCLSASAWKNGKRRNWMKRNSVS